MADFAMSASESSIWGQLRKIRALPEDMFVESCEATLAEAVDQIIAAWQVYQRHSETEDNPANRRDFARRVACTHSWELLPGHENTV